MHCIPIPEPCTPAWATAVLRASGALVHGEVTAVKSELLGAFNSRTSKLALEYSADAPSDMPSRLILKRNNQKAWGIEAGYEEVKFYTHIASLPDHPPVTVPCFAAAFDAQSGESYILLKDLSDTHHPPISREAQIRLDTNVLSDVDVSTVIDSLAQLHAYWWNHPYLKTDTFEVGYWWRNAERFERYIDKRQPAWENLITHEADWFPEDLHVMYTHLFEGLHGHWLRYLKPRFHNQHNLTLLHGDAYFANFLCPKMPGCGLTYLIDWQSPSFDIGAYDLVNLFATFWTSEYRQEYQREKTWLAHYHKALQYYGVNDYTYDDLLLDYRTGLIFWVLMPIQDCSDGAGKAYWWPKTQCLSAAYQEWQCEELL